VSTDGPVEVHVVLPGGDQVHAGTIRFHEKGAVASATFTYADDYLSNPRAYTLDPTLPLDAGAHQTPPGMAVFPAMGDSAPDRWGRNLMRRAEKERARALGVTPRTLLESDFLLGARDDLRQGALRFQTPGGPFLAPPSEGVPKLVSLPRLLDLSDRLSDHDLRDRDLADLVDAGGSLGGARPKAAVDLGDGVLGIAKLPRRGSDEWDVMGWEKTTLDLAEAAGLQIPRSRLIQIRGRGVLVVERFDRDQSTRLGYVSALTLLEATDGDRRSYVEVADVVDRFSPAPGRDLEQLFRRVAFSVLTSNTDDHLRNHGFLRARNGWALSPAFDLNPNPQDPGTLSTTIDMDSDPAASIDALLGTAAMYRLTPDRAARVIGEVEQATASWRAVAARMGLPAGEVQDMSGAFETPERDRARKLAAAHRTSSTPSSTPRIQPRQPSGTPSGGEFAVRRHSEPDVHL
jgi:serine/threonine-protein kinase HipA